MKKEKKEEKIEVLTRSARYTEKNKKRNKLKASIIHILLILSLVFIAVFCLYLDYAHNLENKEEKQKIINEVKKNYNKYVVVTKDSKLYDQDYNKVGTVYKDVNIILDDMIIEKDTRYYKLKLGNYYVSYKDVKPIEDISEYSDRYKRYVVFNENIITKDKTNFYDDNNKLTYTFDKSFEFKIIIKDSDKYGIEFDNRLFYILKDDVKSTKKVQNTKESVRENIRTITYHTIYNTETEECNNSVICHPIEQFDEHMKYISDNKYLTLTMEELEMFLDKKIRIPIKSIVITLDDGKYAKNAVDIVEKYKVNATYFIIGKRHSVKGIETTYMDFQSHSYDLHNNYKCPGGEQGGQLLCETEENILADLKKNKELLGGDVFAFAYPFFDWNERAIEILKKAGIRLAFIGQYDTDGFSDFDTNRLLLRRKTIFSDDTVEILQSYLES